MLRRLLLDCAAHPVTQRDAGGNQSVCLGCLEASLCAVSAFIGEVESGVTEGGGVITGDHLPDGKATALNCRVVQGDWHRSLVDDRETGLLAVRADRYPLVLGGEDRLTPGDAWGRWAGGGDILSERDEGAGWECGEERRRRPGGHRQFRGILRRCVPSWVVGCSLAVGQRVGDGDIELLVSHRQDITGHGLAHLETAETLSIIDDGFEGLKIAARPVRLLAGDLHIGSGITIFIPRDDRRVAGKRGGEFNPVVPLEREWAGQREGDLFAIVGGNDLESVHLTCAISLSDDAVKRPSSDGIAVGLNHLDSFVRRDFHSGLNQIFDGDRPTIRIVLLQPGAAEVDSPVDGLGVHTDASGALGCLIAGGEGPGRSCDDVLTPRMGDDIILPVDDHGAAGAGSGVPGDELSPEAALEIRPATDLLIEGAGDCAFFDLAVPHLDSANRQGLDHSPLPVAAVTVDEGSRKLDRECLAGLGIGGGGVEGDIQIEVVAGDELPSRRGNRRTVL